MAEKTLATRKPEPEGVNLEVDQRPEVSSASSTPSLSHLTDDNCSPYASDICTLNFGNNEPLYIPRQLLLRSVTLASQTRVANHFGLSLRTLDFENIALDTGHTLVHFLFKVSYECLKPKGESPAETNTAELATAFRVHAVAESWNLPSLYRNN
jgi:hypothetical protein